MLVQQSVGVKNMTRRIIFRCVTKKWLRCNRKQQNLKKKKFSQKMFATETQCDERQRNLRASVQTASAVQTHSDRLCPGACTRHLWKDRLTGQKKSKRICFCLYLSFTVGVKNHNLHLVADVLLASADTCPLKNVALVNTWEQGVPLKTQYLFTPKAAWEVHEKSKSRFWSFQMLHWWRGGSGATRLVL